MVKLERRTPAPGSDEPSIGVLKTAKPADKFIEITNAGSATDTTLTALKGGNYSVDFSGNTVVFNRGGSTTLTDAQFNDVERFDFSKVNKLSITGISFTEADEATNGKFEPDANYDKFLKSLLNEHGVAGTVELLDVNGGKADVFKLIWDYVDDQFSYYNTAINKIGVELGLAYAEYLQEGGKPLTDVIAKYTPDGGDAGVTPDRFQSIHDNMLGNLHINSIIDKFFDDNATNGAPNTHGDTGYALGGSNGAADEVTGQRLLDLIFQADLDGRPVYSGNEGADPTPTRDWDSDHFPSKGGEGHVLQAETHGETGLSMAFHVHDADFFVL